MKSKVILLLGTIGLIYSCQKETPIERGSPVTTFKVLLLFKMNDMANKSVWDSYNEYLSDSTQRPHQPIIEWENGELSKLNYDYLEFESSPDMEGSYFSFEGYEIFQRVFSYSQDSTACGVINWNQNHSDTISITRYQPKALNSIRSADFIVYNGDTLFDKRQITTQARYLSFYQQPIFFVKIKTGIK